MSVHEHDWFYKQTHQSSSVDIVNVIFGCNCGEEKVTTLKQGEPISQEAADDFFGVFDHKVLNKAAVEDLELLRVIYLGIHKHRVHPTLKSDGYAAMRLSEVMSMVTTAIDRGINDFGGDV